MPQYRQVVFATGCYYHVFNRGVDKNTTFFCKKDFDRALKTLDYYRFVNQPVSLSHFIKLGKKDLDTYLKLASDSEKHVEIVAFCLMENHYHLLLKQTANGGISKFMSLFSNSYSRYINTRLKRTGPLFTGIFKAVYVDTPEQLLHLTRYIHSNPVKAKYTKMSNLENYKWSSYPSYIGQTMRRMLSFSNALEEQSLANYKKFVEAEEQAEDAIGNKLKIDSS